MSANTAMNQNQAHDASSPTVEFQETTRRVAEEIGRVGKEIGHAGKLARKVAEEQVSEFGKMGEQHLGKMLEAVRERPLTSVLVSFGIGYLGALLFRR